MTLEIIIIPKVAMLLQQSSLWDLIETFLHLLLDPIFLALQEESMRRIILSTVIWSFLITCGLIFAVYEFPALIKLVYGSSPTPVRRQLKTVTKSSKTPTVTASAKRHKISRDKSQKEREKREDAVRKTGVRVVTKIVQERDQLRLFVRIKNGSTSQIDMVVVDLDLPVGSDAAVGSFRMQRLGSIGAGETKTAEFLLNPMGGEPLDIGGYIEFLGASYEVSKIPLPVPEMDEEDITNE